MTTFPNWSLPVPACTSCLDIRAVAAAKTPSEPCPKCGTLADPAYSDFRKKRYAQNSAAPEICVLDLSPDELVVYRDMRASAPTASQQTVLAWIEGLRYNPADDPEFLEEVEALMVDYRNDHAAFNRNRNAAAMKLGAKRAAA